MAYDWGSLGSSMSPYASMLSSIGNTVTNIMASKKMADISKKYQKRFLFLEQEKAKAEDEAKKQLIELEKEKMLHQMELEEATELEKGKIFKEWLYRKEEKPVTENLSLGIIMGFIFLIFIFTFGLIK